MATPEDKVSFGDRMVGVEEKIRLDSETRALPESGPRLDGLAGKTTDVQWLKPVFSLGCSWKGSFLYQA
jgi:hypothetical protein